MDWQGNPLEIPIFHLKNNGEIEKPVDSFIRNQTMKRSGIPKVVMWRISDDY